MAAARLDLVTAGTPLDVLDAVNPTADGMAFLNGVEHPILREQIRDDFVNAQFRRDIYQRGVRRLSPREHREALLATRIVLLRRADLIPLKVKGAAHEATLQEAVHAPLLAELASGAYAPKTLGDLMQALPGVALARLVEAAAVLVGAGHAAPCQNEAAVQSVRQTSDALNRHLIERARLNSDIAFLASPVIGAGVAVNRFQQLFLLARSRGGERPADWARSVWQLLSDQGQKLVKDGQTLETAGANIDELVGQAVAFADEPLPILRALEIA
ncbi:methyltransferase regulatory domain-containing protein [Rhodopila globiformis]|nr:methyltransferase regulatory domain-containing protein [Rhodopila globiformis]